MLCTRICRFLWTLAQKVSCSCCTMVCISQPSPKMSLMVRLNIFLFFFSSTSLEGCFPRHKPSWYCATGCNLALSRFLVKHSLLLPMLRFSVEITCEVRKQPNATTKPQLPASPWAHVLKCHQKSRKHLRAGRQLSVPPPQLSPSTDAL